MSQIIACPSCRKKYQVNSDVAGKTMQCPACKTKFTVGGAAARQNPATVPQPSQVPQANSPDMAAMGVGGLLPSQQGLFPDLPAQPTANPAASPLGNHVIQDPGFAAVDVEEIRQKREREAAKKNKLRDAFSSSSSIADLDESKTKVGRTGGYLSADTLFDFDGRISRKMFWIGSLLYGAILLGCLLVSAVVFALIGYMADIKPTDDDLMLVIPMWMISVAIIGMNSWVNMAFQIKRYHDIGHSGWRIWLSMIPLIGPFWVIIEIGFQPGEPTKNQYGQPPPRNPTLFGTKPGHKKKVAARS